MAKSGNKLQTASPITRAPRKNETVRVRQIDNGFIVSHETTGKNGEYKCTERYCAQAPNLMSGLMKPGRKK